MKTLTIFVNDESIYEYDKKISLDEQQLKFLDKMDSDMERGIKIQGELIVDPDNKQKATFVAMNLIRALQQDNEAAISVSCAYLATRIPATIEIHANSNEGTVNIEFVEEH